MFQCDPSWMRAAASVADPGSSRSQKTGILKDYTPRAAFASPTIYTGVSRIAEDGRRSSELEKRKIEYLGIRGRGRPSCDELGARESAV
jgi:hypothetical protein